MPPNKEQAAWALSASAEEEEVPKGAKGTPPAQTPDWDLKYLNPKP